MKIHLLLLLYKDYLCTLKFLIMYFMQKVNPPILEKQRQIFYEHNNL